MGRCNSMAKNTEGPTDEGSEDGEIEYLVRCASEGTRALAGIRLPRIEGVTFERTVGETAMVVTGPPCYDEIVADEDVLSIEPNAEDVREWIG